MADMMRTLSWRTGTSVRELAKAWRLSRTRTHKLAAIASRRVRAEMAEAFDPQMIRATLVEAMSRLIGEAVQDGDRRNAVAAAAVIVKALDGVPAGLTQRHVEICISGPDDVLRMEPSETGRGSPTQAAPKVVGAKGDVAWHSQVALTVGRTSPREEHD